MGFFLTKCLISIFDRSLSSSIFSFLSGKGESREGKGTEVTKLVAGGRGREGKENLLRAQTFYRTPIMARWKTSDRGPVVRGPWVWKTRGLVENPGYDCFLSPKYEFSSLK